MADETTETYNREAVECPGCGFMQTDELYLIDDDADSWECPSCGDEWLLSVYSTRTFTVSSRAPGAASRDGEGSDHV